MMNEGEREGGFCVAATYKVLCSGLFCHEGVWRRARGGRRCQLNTVRNAPRAPPVVIMMMVLMRQNSVQERAHFKAPRRGCHKRAAGVRLQFWRRRRPQQGRGWQRPS